MTTGRLPSRDRRLYRVCEAMDLLSLSRSVLYEQIRAGRLRSVTQGRTRLIPASAITEYVALLEKEAQERDHTSQPRRRRAALGRTA